MDSIQHQPDVFNKSINPAHCSGTDCLCLWSHLYLRRCLQMGCQWMIWIHHPQRCCELLAARRSRRAEDCPPAEGGNEAPGRLPAAESAPAEGADGDSWQSALWKMWHTGLPTVAGSKKLF